MKVTGKGTLYKNQYGWSISDNQKQADGTYNNFYIPVYLAKALQEPNDKSFVSIEGFTKPFKYKDGKQGISYVITDYVVIGRDKEDKPEQQKNKIQEQQEVLNQVINNDPFEDFGQEVVLTDDDLPF